MQGRLGLLLAVIVVLAGCLGSQDPTGAGPGQEGEDARALELVTSTAMPECPSSRGIECFEPSLAVDDEGRIYTTTTPCEAIARSTDDGASFEELELPPRPPEAPPEPRLGDCTLDVGPDGRVYFHALVAPETNRLSDQRVAGIQVAASGDGAETWETNTWVHPASRDANRNVNTDRQWLTFGGEGRVYLTYWQFATQGFLPDAYIAVSDDGAESFGPAREMPGILPGNPVATERDTLHAPWFPITDERYIARVSTTTDGGESFEIHDVHEAEGGTRGSYPVLALGDEGRIYAAWIEETGRVLAARGTPAGGWSSPVEVNPEAANATIDAAPDIRVHGGTVDVAWYRSSGEDQRYVVGRLPVEGFPSRAPQVHVVGSVSGSEPVTDFATFDLTNGGRAVFAWTDPGDGVQVAVEAS